MTEQIGVKLTEMISPIVPVNLSEAETESYPYAVYEYVPRPVLSKDGIEAYRATATISIVSDDFDEARGIFEQLCPIIEQMRTPTFHASMTDVAQECMEGLWTIRINLTIKQS